MEKPSNDALRQVVHLFHEVSRRNVVRAAMAYLVAAWVAAQVGGLVFPVLGWSEQAMRVLLALLAIGLLVAIWVAWQFDLTPEGLRRTPGAPDESAPAATASPALLPSAPPDPLSIAVLAFADRSQGSTDEFLAHGLSEDLINTLGRAGKLRLAPRTSSFAFKPGDLDLREIGRRLNVAYVLDGSIRRTGDWLRIAVELVDVGTGLSQWVNAYDSSADLLLEVQEDIAQRVVDQIRPGRQAGEALAIRIDRGTRNTDAYNAYLKGRFYWNSRYAVGLERSIECFGEAAKLDPGYAQPLSGLADAYSLLAFYNFIPPRDGFGKAGDFARRAHQLAPQLAETNASLAFVQHFFEWNYGAAETSYRRALQADPNYGPARFWFAFLLASIGRPEDARAEIAAARAAEPFSSIITGGASYLDYFLGDHALGLSTAAAALEADPNFGPGHMFLGFHYGATGRHEQAVKCWRAAVERLDRLLLARLMLAAAHARAGDPAQARSLLLQLDNTAQGYISPYFRAIAALALGDREAALGLLETALADRNSFLVLAGLEPLLVELHGEPRFLRVVEQVGVPLATVERPALSA